MSITTWKEIQEGYTFFALHVSQISTVGFCSYRSGQIWGRERSSRAGVAGTCLVWWRAGPPRCCFPSPRPTIHPWGSIPVRKSGSHKQTGFAFGMRDLDWGGWIENFFFLFVTTSKHYQSNDSSSSAEHRTCKPIKHLFYTLCPHCVLLYRVATTMSAIVIVQAKGHLHLADDV